MVALSPPDHRVVGTHSSSVYVMKRKVTASTGNETQVLRSAADSVLNELIMSTYRESCGWRT